jgi:hypothetical protein
MITTIEPERGGESQGVLRVVMDVPFLPSELRELRDWLDERGWSVEVDQIDAYFSGEDWQSLA